MSDHDRDATIAVLTKRYADARSAREAHVRTITTFRAKLHKFARTLASVEGFIPSGKSIPRMPPDYPANVQIAAALDELRAVCDEVGAHRETLEGSRCQGSEKSRRLPPRSQDGFLRVSVRRHADPDQRAASREVTTGSKRNTDAPSTRSTTLTIKTPPACAPCLHQLTRGQHDGHPISTPSSMGLARRAVHIVLITGGTGFTGSHLVHRLVSEGRTVRVLARATSNTDRCPGVSRWSPAISRIINAGPRDVGRPHGLSCGRGVPPERTSPMTSTWP